jgi:hypothetical protein
MKQILVKFHQSVIVTDTEIAPTLEMGYTALPRSYDPNN